MRRRILVLGGTGMLGRPVVQSLSARGHVVRVLTRDTWKARRLFGTAVEAVEGTLEPDRLRKALEGCDAVHVSLPPEAELFAVEHVAGRAAARGLERVSYVSGTSVSEENRWFEPTDVKLRAEAVLRRSGIPHTVFCPTWAMETLPRFVRGGRAAVIEGRNPPALHFVAADDFGRMVATAYEDDRALGRRLYVHGPEAFTLTEALETFLAACHPEVEPIHFKLWQARLVGRLTGRMETATRLVAYFDEVGEPGAPAAANALLGAPGTTLQAWIARRAAEAPR